MPKGAGLAEATSNSEKIKSVALPLLSYACLKESISQSVSRKFCLIIIHSNLLKEFQVVCFGLSFT